MAIKYKNSLTIGDAAEACAISASKMKRMFDRGMIEGYVLPDSRDRRVTPESLIKFMNKHGLPIPPGLPHGLDREDHDRTLKQVIDNLENHQCEKSTKVLLNAWAQDLRKLF